MMDFYLRSGLPARQLHLTGALYDDVLYGARADAARRRDTLYEKLGLRAGRPMILCALPPDQLKGLGRSQCEFSNYADLLNAFLEPLKEVCTIYNVILSLHPRITASEMSQLDTTGVAISRDDIAELIPLCEVYVASCSATIRLAVTCGIPVVNFDVYGYDYDEYKVVPGIATIAQSSAYRFKVRQLFASRPEIERMSEAQRCFARTESPLDGMAGKRLLGLLEELTSRRGKPRLT